MSISLSEQRVLAPYKGDKPPAPGWFAEALKEPYEIVPLVHDGAALELLCWGRDGAPGLLLLHGNRAHARWWSPLAGLLSRDFRVAALSWSGMGGSDWRDRYALEGFAGEALAAAQAAGLFAAGPPVFVAHSFGGGPGVIAAEQYGDRLAGVVILDTHLTEGTDKILIPPVPQHRVQATVAEALARFRLVPPQDCANHYYVDWIARNALRPAPTDADEHGLTWSFDPKMWEKLDWYDRWTAVARPRCPLVFIDGGESRVSATEGRCALRAQAPANTRFEVIAGAAHHLMLDKPLEVTNAIARIAAELQQR